MRLASRASADRPEAVFGSGISIPAGARETTSPAASAVAIRPPGQVEDCARIRNRRAPLAGLRERVDEELEPAERFQHPGVVNGIESPAGSSNTRRLVWAGRAGMGGTGRAAGPSSGVAGTSVTWWVGGRIVARNRSRNQAFVDRPFGDVLVRQTHDQPPGHSLLGPDLRVLAAHKLDVVALDGQCDEVGRTDEVDDEVRCLPARDELERVRQKAPTGRESISVGGDDAGSRCTTASYHASPRYASRKHAASKKRELRRSNDESVRSHEASLVVAAGSFARTEARFKGLVRGMFARAATLSKSRLRRVDPA